VAAITGLDEERIVALGTRLAHTRPTGIRATMGLQRHAGGGMALRTISAIPGVTGDWRYPGGGVVYSTSGYFGANRAGLFRDDLLERPVRSLVMTRLGEGLLEVDDPPVMALVVYGANPMASTPDQRKVRRGLQREDLFTVVMEQFGIDLDRLRREGWVRLNYPRPFVPFADGFPTASGKLEFLSQAAADDGLDPLPGYTPPAETTDERLAERYPLALVAPASHYFLNTMFANDETLRRRAGGPRIVLHPGDARERGLRDGDRARVRNARGEFTATVEVSDAVRRGVAASTKGHWIKHVGANANATVPERDADMGDGAVYHDNRVEVERAAL
jgi:anaerobic selenocysteine-containing dehydrogenase